MTNTVCTSGHLVKMPKLQRSLGEIHVGNSEPSSVKHYVVDHFGEMEIWVAVPNHVVGIFSYQE